MRSVAVTGPRFFRHYQTFALPVRSIYLTPRTTSISNSRSFLRNVLRFNPKSSRGSNLIAPGCRERKLQQRALNLSQHTVVKSGGRNPVTVSREVPTKVPFDGLAQQLSPIGRKFGKTSLGKFRFNHVEADGFLRDRVRLACGSGFRARAHCHARDAASAAPTRRPPKS